MAPTLKVLDLSHHNDGPNGGPIDFKAIADFGILGVILKASQGTGMVDATYATRKQAAVAAGLLVGAYHFATNDDVDAQVKHFLDAAQPDDSTLMALDHEPNNGNQLDLDGCQAFLESARDQLGRKLVLYSGNLIKEQLGDKPSDFFGSHRLWLAQYGPVPKVPAAWDSVWLWQFSDGVVNSQGIKVPGISGQVDMNSWDGTDDDLAGQWTR
jgi:lysozyme